MDKLRQDVLIIGLFNYSSWQLRIMFLKFIRCLWRFFPRLVSRQIRGLRPALRGYVSGSNVDPVKPMAISVYDKININLSAGK